MSAGIPDGWVTWRRSWRTSELVDYGGIAEQTAALLTAARRDAEREGLEVHEYSTGIIRQQGEFTNVTLTVRPRVPHPEASFRE